jgi:pimeloyl-ACP methyl ester carboxylesterase
MRVSTHRMPGLVLTDHTFAVPLDHTVPDGEQITVFAREVVAPKQEDDDLPWLVFFQGGPGNESPRPPGRSGWLERALQEYRVLLLDQRGTGLSTPVNHQTLARFPAPLAQARYLMHFRADSIVRDAELIRRELLGDDVPWTALGQSYGGFCVTRYLSASPGGLREAILTGGLPPLARPAEDVYRATYQRVLTQNKRYFERYPGDARRAREIADYLDTHDVRMADGSRLTTRRFQQLGLHLGASGGFEQIHYLLELAFVEGAAGREINQKFLGGLDGALPFEATPIFAILHEAIYAQGTATHWAAHRVRAEYPEVDARPGQPFLFTGEMIYPWMFDEYPALRPLKEAAEILAVYEDWPPLYDIEALQANTVPCVASVYNDDMYVERAYSEETARHIRGLRMWITNEYEHNGLRADGDRVLGRLLDMLHGEQ